MEKVRQRKLNLEPGGDTAISAQIAHGKKAQIARRLERLARDLGSDPLEVGAVKMDENYAGVVVRKIGGLDPGRLQVFALALVKREAEWTVAPVPASFENAGAGYATLLRLRLKTLEDWMLREQVVDLQNLREKSRKQMQRKIEASLKADELRALTAKQTGERFITACEKGELPAVLGLIGGLSASLPEDWLVRLRSADRAISAGPFAPHPWRLLTAPEVARIIVQHEEEKERAMVSIACLDPSGGGIHSPSPRVELIHLELTKDEEGLWRINPPPSFLQEEEPPLEDPDEQLDADLLNQFSTEWRESHPATPQSSPELARQALVQALRQKDLRALLNLAHLSDAPETARKRCVEAARTWWQLHDPTVVRHAMPLAMDATETSAVALFQIVSAKDPSRYEPKEFHLEKTAAGWLWNPTPPAELVEPFKRWTQPETQRWSSRWQSTLLADSPVMKVIEAALPPNEDESRDLIGRWHSATQRGDFEAALGLIACLGDAKSPSIALQNLGYEIQSARRRKSPPEITRIHQGKSWTAVGVKADDGKPNHPFYPMVRTPRGLRILIETDLFASANRSRDFLNRAAFDRLQKATSAAAATELRELYAQHQNDVDHSLKKD